MVYLLLRQTTMMSAVADIAHIRFQDTCAEAKQFIAKVVLKSVDKKERLKRLCEEIMAVEAVVKPEEVKGDKSKSVLFDACRLAKELNTLGDDKWEKICKVWAELLSYAAIRCRPEKPCTNAQQRWRADQFGLADDGSSRSWGAIPD
ncbi:hypothetical protein Ancab_014917 [Ancistrocladus abbreviatus]